MAKTHKTGRDAGTGAPSPRERPKVFVSYARSDSQFALKLARDLREAGANLWVDQFDIPVGARWDRAVQAALNACPCLLVILSPAAVASENVMDEVSFALSKDKKIFPVLSENCDIPFRLTRFQYIDFTADYDTAFPKLFKELGVYAISTQQPTSLSTINQIEPVALAPSFDKGLYGGLIGGAIAGLIVGVLYYYLASQESYDPECKAGIALVLMILGYGAVVGATFGLCTQQAILWLGLGAFNKPSFGIFREAEIAGGVLGGAAAGTIAGALGGWWFGDLCTPMIKLGLIMGGSLIGLLCLVLGVLFYDHRGHWWDVQRALVLGAVISAFFATIGVAALHALQIDNYFIATAPRPAHIQGGAMIGFVVLTVLGLLFGLTLRLHGRRRPKAS